MLASVKLVELRDLLALVVEEAHSGLQALADKLPGQPDHERKRALLLHLHATRQRLQRLHAAVAWSNKSRAEAAAHNAALVHATDQLFHLHGELLYMAAPAYDVGTALHVLQTGGYSLLPSTIEEGLQLPPPQRGLAERRAVVARMDCLLRSKLLADALPPGLRVLCVDGGQAHVAAAGGQYTARLSLTPAPLDEVVLERYRPPAEEDRTAAPKEEPEVTQPIQQQQQQQEVGAAGQAAAPGAAGPSGGGAGVQGESARWRWQLMSLEVLPALEAGRDPPLVPQAHTIWLRQHTQERMMVAADVQQLARLGKQHWVAMRPSAARRAAKGKRSAGGTASATAAEPSTAPSAARSGPTPSGITPGAEGQWQQQAEDAERLPDWASRPLLLMHSALQQAAVRVALYNLLLPQARELAAGGWPGGVRVDRAEGGGGIRLTYWHKAAWLTHAELEALAATSGASGAAAALASSAPPAVELLLQEGGTALGCVAVPQLRHPLSGGLVALPVDLGSPSCSAERLLLAAASNNAATQLAGVQAVLRADSRLAAAGVLSDLVLPPSVGEGLAAAAAGGAPGKGAAAAVEAASSGRAAVAQLASPLLQVWWRGQVQLGVSLQLRSARMLLAPGPGVLEQGSGGDGAAAAASPTADMVDAAQHQLDRLQREVFSRPLPAGNTRGMLAARLAAGVIADLLLRLTTHQRLEAVATRAAAVGLHRSPLPPALLMRHRRHMAAPDVMPQLSDSVLLLALPSFPAPADMRRLAEPRTVQGDVGGGSGSRDCGAVSCHLLIDLSPSASDGASGMSAADASAGADQQQQQQGGEQQGLQGLEPGCWRPRLGLVVCASTSRGTATRVLRALEVPPDASSAGVGEAPQRHTAAAGAKPGLRKRGREEEEQEERRQQQEQADAPAAASEHGAAQGASETAETELDLAAVARWCQRQAACEQLLGQLQALQLTFAEELALGASANSGSYGTSLAGPPAWMPAVRLPTPNNLHLLERWWAARGFAGGGGDGGIPQVYLRVDAEAEAGAWRMEVHSAYVGRARQLWGALGVAVAPPPAGVELHGWGSLHRYSLARGDSAVTAITDLMGAMRTHVCLTRMRDAMATSPLAPPQLRSQEVATANGGRGTENGWLSRVAVGGGGGSGSVSESALVWALPGCGEVAVMEVGLGHIVLAVQGPPPLPSELVTDGPPSPSELVPVRVTMRWVSAYSPRESATEAAETKDATACAGTSGAAAAAAGDGGAAAQKQQHKWLAQCVRCSVSASPALPASVTAALAAQLEAGSEHEFLDALCVAAHPAAAVQQHLGSPAAQRSAGLLPGALASAPSTPMAASAPSPYQLSAPSPYQLAYRMQQGGRALQLRLQLAQAGFVLLQLRAAPEPGASLPAARGAAAPPWLEALWTRLQGQAGFRSAPPAPSSPSSGSKRAPQAPAHTAWFHWEGLPAALAVVLRTVATGVP
eukprot:scaffold4.g4973.t1